MSGLLDEIRRRVELIAERLRAAGCIAAEEEAQLLSDAAPDDAALDALVRRREQGEPLAWLLGWTEFCGRRLRIAPGVYVPRPHTEDLARRAAALLAPGGRAADLCTGCGAIAAHLAAVVPDATVVAVDIDPAAVACARANGVDARRAQLDELDGDHDFDVVTAVPPYVPAAELRLLAADVQRYEPRAALDGGADGLDLARRVVAAAARLLAPGGWLLLELGAEQDRELAQTLSECGFAPAEALRDEDCDIRGVVAQVGR
jgi:release factor glutamine methyltransferase